MPRPSLVADVALYEWRRILARKKIQFFILIVVLFEVLPPVIVNQIPARILPAGIKDSVWLIGAIAPHALLIQIIAVVISSGALAEEHEQGTVEVILTKPLTRGEFYLGKFVGGYVILLGVIALAIGLAVLSSTVAFGPQRYTAYAPLLFLASSFASFVFYAFGFALGEILRRSSLTYLISTTLLVSMVFIGGILFLTYNLTLNQIYVDAAKALPSWAVRVYPLMVAEALFLRDETIVHFLLLHVPQPEGSIAEATLSILAYTVALFTLGLAHIRRVDIVKRHV